jgi:hypothetical protein
MDPATLANVLELDEPPKLQPAKLTSVRCKLWGPYPALLSGPCRSEVKGVALEVQSAEQVKRLKQYETRRYSINACSILLEDGPRVGGRAFYWWSQYDQDELREGVFDLEEYLKDH